MTIIERCLLYTMSVVLGAVLLFDRAGADAPEPQAANSESVAPASPQPPPPSAPSAARPPVAARAVPSLNVAKLTEARPPQTPAATPTVSSNNAAPARSINLADAQGRTRIELTVGTDGQPQIALRDESGQALLELRLTDGGGSVVIQSSKGSARLQAAADGRMSLDLLGSQGAAGRLSLAPAGDVEISTTAGPGGTQAALRTRRDGSAEITVGGEPGQPVASLSAKPGGHLELRMTGKAGTPGPALQFFDDATAQLTLNGPGSQSGPSLIRFPNGLSVIAVRRPDGNPGASMVASPDNSSVIATLPRPGGKQQAEMRSYPDGKATMRVVAASQPQPEKSPEPPPREIHAVPQDFPPDVLSVP